ncbi:MAG: type III-B CRISPR module-associated protein Cmr5 [Lentisphaerae bacterium]|nr:type III-B CRISPR module-associated protein Cmr5 [Lentisphaerota bacterium]
MINMEQIRSRNALLAIKSCPGAFTGANEGAIVKKVPTMIQQNGLIAALAFALEDQKKAENSKRGDSGYALVFAAVFQHLKCAQVGFCPAEISKLSDFANWLVAEERSSAELRLLTKEALAYMNLFRRYA